MDAEQQVHRYQHRAMATIFEVLIAGEERTFADGAARAAFEDIDRLEQELSRFIPNSDIARLSNAVPHQTIRLGSDAFRCLQIGQQCWQETHGAFDPTVGDLVDRSLGRISVTGEAAAGAVSARGGMDQLVLDEASMTVQVGERVPQLDLGAVGKGYAVDRAAEILKEWGAGSALIHGGTSSVFAFGAYQGVAGWPVTLSDPDDATRVIASIRLDARGVGGSGLRRGAHIVDPRTQQPAGARRAAWVSCESAARSDALSTAYMVMAVEELTAHAAADGRLWAIVVGSPSEGTLALGRPPAVRFPAT